MKLNNSKKKNTKYELTQLKLLWIRAYIKISLHKENNLDQP